MHTQTFIRPAALLSFALTLSSQLPLARAGLLDTFIGPTNGLWSNPANWSLNLVPNNNSAQSFDVTLTTPAAATVLLDTSVTINTLTINSPDTLSLQNSQSLTLAGGLLSNSGTILINQTSSLLFSANTLLSGNGTIWMLSPSALISGPPTSTVTSSNLIGGFGTLGGVKFVNNGVIYATTQNNNMFAPSGTLTIQPPEGPDGFTNNGVIKGLLAGLVLAPAEYDNTNGRIGETYDSGAKYSGTITGGTFIGSSLGPIQYQSGMIFQGVTLELGGLTPPSMNLSGTCHLLGNLFLGGVAGSPPASISNTGTLFVASSAPYNESALVMYHDANITGGGTIVLTTPYCQLQADISQPRLVSDNTIAGQGTIGNYNPISITNLGTFDATIGMLSINCTSTPDAFINTGTLRADGGSLILSSAGSITNSSGLIEALHNSTVLINTNISGGTLRASSGGLLSFATGSHTAAINSLELSTDSTNAFTATLNLNTSNLILQSSSAADKQSKIAFLDAAISSASAGNTWTGKGITFNTAIFDPNHYTLALADNALLKLTTFANQSVDSTSLLVAIAHLGDANLDGIVDIQDLNLIANNWQKPATNWAAGDLNLDGTVDIQDFTLVANNWQQTSLFTSLQPADLTLSASVPESLSALPPAPVPEPLTLTLFTPVTTLLLRRKRHPHSTSR